MASIVCLFLHRYGWGYQIRGDERGFLEKAIHYKSHGLTLLTVEKRPSLQKPLGNDLYDSFYVSDFHLPIRNPIDLARVIYKSAKTLGHLKKLKPFAVYAYNQDPENVITGLIFKLVLGRPLVVVYHHITRLWFAPLGLGIVERRRTGYGLLSSIWLSIVPALNRFSANLADVHLALSAATKSEVEAWVGVVGCTVVGNGVDLKKFKPIEMEKRYEAAFLGRIVRQKGIETLLRAWLLVRRNLPNSRLVLIGGADAAEKQVFRNLAENMGIADSVDFVGFLSDQEAVKALNSSRLFVFPSTKEGFAQAVSQAMACGLCCLISDIPALRETYGQVAVLVPPNNPEAFADRIVTMLADEQKLVECGSRSREFVARFDWGKVVEKELNAMKRPSK